MYRWLKQQGEAFGAPGMEPRWTSSLKDAVGTAYVASSRIWFTCSHGILNEIYHPTIDRAQPRDMEFLITDGETFVHEEKRDLFSAFEYIHPEALGVCYVNRDPDGRYSLTKEVSFAKRRDGKGLAASVWIRRSRSKQDSEGEVGMRRRLYGD